MNVLDLFGGGGGACEGYVRAGATVVGVDLKHSVNYPGTLVVADALEFARLMAGQFDFIHASPPCQGYSSHVVSADSKHNHTRGKNEPRLIDAVRDILTATGKPFVIENVMGAKAELINPIQLCGTMFGLPLSRHRLFEVHGFEVEPPIHPKCSGVAKRYATENGIDYRDMSVTGKGRRAGTATRWATFLDVRHPMTQHELAESIPPAYTHFILSQYLKTDRR